MLQKSKVNMLLDLYYGSSAKGQMCAAIAQEEKPEILIANHSTSASHTVATENEEFVFKVLPSASFISKIDETYQPDLYLMPSTGFELEQLLKEVKYVGAEARTYIHELAVVIQPEHKNLEAGLARDGSDKEMIDDSNGIRYLGSTMSGQSYAFADKITRNKEHVSLARDFKEQLQEAGIAILSSNKWIEKLNDSILNEGKTALAEMPQGFALSADHSGHYPMTTFRNITPQQFMADLGLNHNFIGSVILNVRSLPIRVSNRFENDDMSKVKLLAVETDQMADESKYQWKTPEELGMTYADVNAITYNLKFDDATIHSTFGNFNILDMEGVVGTSGAFESDMEEISWKQLSKELSEKMGDDVNVEEITTLTKLNRRIAKIKDGRSISVELLTKALRVMSPTHISVTFLNYIDPKLNAETFENSQILQEWISQAFNDIDDALLEADTLTTVPKLSAVQWGKTLDDVLIIQ